MSITIFPLTTIRTAGKRPVAAVIAGLLILGGLNSSFAATGESGSNQPAAASSLLDQIVLELHGVSISQAKVEDLVRAVRKVVARNPKEAVTILADVLAVERSDREKIAGPLVAAAIEGVGPEITEQTLASIVRVGIELERPATVSIVRCASRAVPSCDMVSVIVDVASQKPVIVSDGKQIVAPEGKEIVPTEGKDVVALEGKAIVPQEGKSVVAVERPPEDQTLLIAKTAFEARPDCFTAGPKLPPHALSSSVTNPTLLEASTKTPVLINPFPLDPSN